MPHNHQDLNALKEYLNSFEKIYTTLRLIKTENDLNFNTNYRIFENQLNEFFIFFVKLVKKDDFYKEFKSLKEPIFISFDNILKLFSRLVEINEEYIILFERAIRQLEEVLEYINSEKINNEHVNYFKDLLHFCLATKSSDELRLLTAELFSENLKENEKKIEDTLRRIIQTNEYLQTKSLKIETDDYDKLVRGNYLRIISLCVSYQEITKQSPFPFNYDVLYNKLVTDNTADTKNCRSFLLMLIAFFLLNKRSYLQAWRYVVAAYNNLELKFDTAEYLSVVEGLVDFLLNEAKWDQVSFVDIYPFYQCLVGLKQLKESRNLELTSYSEDKFLDIRNKVRQAQELHWQSLIKIKNSLKKLCVETKLEKKPEEYSPKSHVKLLVVSLTIPCRESLKHDFVNTFRKLIAENNCAIDFDIEQGCIIVKNLYEIPLTEVEKFHTCFITSIKEYRARKAATIPSLPVTAVVHPPNNQTNQYFQISTNDASKMQRKKKKKGKTKNLQISSEASIEIDNTIDEVVDEISKLSLKNERINLFGKEYQDLSIKPCSMQSIIDKFYVALSDNAHNDDCDPKIRDEFKNKVFIYPRQCHQRGANGFKVRRLNGIPVLEAKLISREAGKFRSYPSKRVYGPNGEVLYVYDSIVKKGGNKEKHHVITDIKLSTASVTDSISPSPADAAAVPIATSSK